MQRSRRRMDDHANVYAMNGRPLASDPNGRPSIHDPSRTEALGFCTACRKLRGISGPSGSSA